MDKTPESKKPTTQSRKFDTPVYYESLAEHLETEPEEDAKAWLKEMDERTAK